MYNVFFCCVFCVESMEIRCFRKHSKYCLHFFRGDCFFGVTFVCKGWKFVKFVIFWHIICILLNYIMKVINFPILIIFFVIAKPLTWRAHVSGFFLNNRKHLRKIKKLTGGPVVTSLRDVTRGGGPVATSTSPAAHPRAVGRAAFKRNFMYEMFC